MAREILFLEAADKIRKVFSLLNLTHKKRVVLISTTAFNDNPNIYFASAKESSSTYCVHFIVSDSSWLPEIITNAKLHKSCMFLDAEIKGEYKSLIQDVLFIDEGLKFHTIKPNDYTCQAVEAIADFYFFNPHQLRVYIFGIGNLGKKIALKLHEKGASVHLVSRDKEKAKKNKLLLEQISNREIAIKAEDYKSVSITGRVLLLGCTSGYHSILPMFVKNICQSSIVVDVGQRNIPQDALQMLNEKGIKVLSLFASDFLLSQIEATFDMQSKISSLNIRILARGKGRLIEPGLIGMKGDILVNDVNNVTKIIGVCDGNGDVLSDVEADIYIKKAGITI